MSKSYLASRSVSVLEKNVRGTRVSVSSNSESLQNKTQKQVFIGDA